MSVLGTCPVADRPIVRVADATTDLAGWYGAIMTNYPTGHRYEAIDRPRASMAVMARLSSGMGLADENLGRPARFAGDANMARIDSIRAAYDPHSRFHGWMDRERLPEHTFR